MAICKFTLFLFLVSFLIGCGGGGHFAPVPPPSTAPEITITAAQVFKPRVGEQRTFVSHCATHDALSFISTEAPGPSDWLPPNAIVWHYSKNDSCGYWQPDVAEAELQFVLAPGEGGEVDSLASLISFPQSCSFCQPGNWTQLTVNIVTPPGKPVPYLIIPASGSNDPMKRTSRQTAYLGYGSLGVLTFNSVVAGAPQPPLTAWRTDSYVDKVCLPAFSFCGFALVSEQWEGPCFPTVQPQCNHERWFFLPEVDENGKTNPVNGLVRVEVLAMGAGERPDGKPLLVMELLWVR